MFDFRGLLDKKDTEVSVSLTQLGRKQAESFVLNGPKLEVVSSLLERGSMTVNEIAEATGMGTSKAREVTKTLMRSGYVKKIS